MPATESRHREYGSTYYTAELTDCQSQGHHTIDRLEERGVESGSARLSSLKGKQRAIVNQSNIGTVSKAALGKLLRDGVERVWAFPSA